MDAENAVYALPWVFHGFFQLNMADRLQLNYNRGKKYSWGRWDWGRSVLRCGVFGIPLYIWTEGWSKVFWLNHTNITQTCNGGDFESLTGWMNLVVRLVHFSTELLSLHWWSLHTTPQEHNIIHFNSIGVVEGLNQGCQIWRFEDDQKIGHELQQRPFYLE